MSFSWGTNGELVDSSDTENKKPNPKQVSSSPTTVPQTGFSWNNNGSLSTPSATTPSPVKSTSSVLPSTTQQLSSTKKTLGERFSRLILGNNLYDSFPDNAKPSATQTADFLPKGEEKLNIEFKAAKEFGHSAIESVQNFVHGLESLGRDTNKPLPSLPGLAPSTEQNHTVEPGYEAAATAGQIVGGAVPYLVGGEAIAPLAGMAEASTNPLIRYGVKAFLNAGLGSAIQQVEPLKEGETRTSRFLKGLPGNLLFGVTSLIPGKGLNAFTTGASQFALGAAQGNPLKENFISSTVMTLFGFAHGANTPEEVISKAQEVAKQEAKTPEDKMAVEMAKQIANAPEKEQQQIAEQALGIAKTAEIKSKIYDDVQQHLDEGMPEAEIAKAVEEKMKTTPDQAQNLIEEAKLAQFHNPDEAKAKIAEIPKSSPEKASVPVMITNKMRADLADKGFSKEEVGNMTPQQAHDALSKTPEEKIKSDAMDVLPDDIAERFDKETFTKNMEEALKKQDVLLPDEQARYVADNVEAIYKESSETDKAKIVENLHEYITNTLKDAKKTVLPTGTREQGSKIAKGAMDANKRLVEKGFDNLSEDQQSKFSSSEGKRKTQIENVAKLITENPDNARRMALGRSPIPNEHDVPPEILYNAMVEHADSTGNYALLADLANSPLASISSEHGSGLEATKYGKGENGKESSGQRSVKAMKEITDSRKVSVEKTLSKEGKTIESEKKSFQKNEEKKLNETVKKKTTRQSLSEFIKNIEC